MQLYFQATDTCHIVTFQHQQMRTLRLAFPQEFSSDLESPMMVSNWQTEGQGGQGKGAPGLVPSLRTPELCRNTIQRVYRNREPHVTKDKRAFPEELKV